MRKIADRKPKLTDVPCHHSDNCQTLVWEVIESLGIQKAIRDQYKYRNVAFATIMPKRWRELAEIANRKIEKYLSKFKN